MSNIVAIWSPFNNVIKPFTDWKPGTPHPALSHSWIKKRFDIWYEYTYKSISNQTDKRYIYLIACNLLSKHITDEIFLDVVKNDKRVKLFYHGTCEFRDTVKNLRENYDNVYAARIDSDDLYSIDVVSYILNEFPKGATCGYFLKGYGYQHIFKRLWNYDCCKSGPFYVVKYPRGLYRFDVIEHPYIKKMGGIVLKDGMFIVSIHENNYSSSIKKPYFVDEIKQKDDILKRFSI